MIRCCIKWVGPGGRVSVLCVTSGVAVVVWYWPFSISKQGTAWQMPRNENMYEVPAAAGGCVLLRASCQCKQAPRRPAGRSSLAQQSRGMWLGWVPGAGAGAGRRRAGEVGGRRASLSAAPAAGGRQTSPCPRRHGSRQLWLLTGAPANGGDARRAARRRPWAGSIAVMLGSLQAGEGVACGQGPGRKWAATLHSVSP